MDPLCLCYKVTNLIFFINPFTCQTASINVEKFNNAPFRSILTSKSLVEYTVIEVSYNPARFTDEATAKKRHFILEEVTVCRSDRLGQPDAVITTMTHLGALLNEGDTIYFAPASIATLAVSASSTVPAPITISSRSSYIFTNSLIISVAYLLVNVTSKPFTFPFTHALAIFTPTSFVFPRTTATTPLP